MTREEPLKKHRTNEAFLDAINHRISVWQSEGELLPLSYSQLCDLRTVFQDMKNSRARHTLLDLMEAWEEGFCHHSDDGGEVEGAIVDHAREVLGVPDAKFDELVDSLRPVSPPRTASQGEDGR